MAKRGPAPIFSDQVQWTLKFSGDTTEYPLPGVASHSTSAGDAPTTDVVTFDGSAQQTGSPPAASITLEIGIYNPYVSVWKKIRAAFLAKQAIQAKWQTQKRSILEGSAALGTIAIAATTGVCTLDPGTASPALVFTGAGENKSIVPGTVLEIASKGYVIDKILTATTFEIRNKPSAAVAASADWEILVPAVGRAYFDCKISQADNEDMPSDGVMSASLVLNPTTALPEIEVVTPALAS